jgi:hypothetical protein
VPSTFTPADLEQLAARGVAVAEAERQLETLAHPPAPIALDRPCTPDDGIVRIGADEGRELLKTHAEVAERGRVLAFRPASGAASRMFGDLIAARADVSLDTAAGLDAAVRAGRVEAKGLRDFLAGIDRFAFFADLKRAVERGGVPMRVLVREGPYSKILDALLAPEGLDYAQAPKGLLPFHDYPGGPRTPLEEHLLEATQIVADRDELCRLHFTVSPEHRARFEARLAEAAPAVGAALDARFEVGFSVQKPSTDTLAADPAGGPFRASDGRLLFRPAGHGALIENLAALDADLVMIKNIDNVAHDRWKDPTFRWSRAVIGLAAKLERRSVGLLRRLESANAAAAEEAVVFLRETFHRAPPAGDRANGADHGVHSGARAGVATDLAAWARAQLARPIRVCGMVPNTGEPGGGPFWVRGRDGAVTPQIVELAEVNMLDESQQRVVAAATHFNPVFMALALKDARDRAYPLAEFVNADAVMIARKSFEGRDLLALERPGLWNGAMAGWNSVFVEVPLTVFNPVKTVNDLLRKEHQPR